MICDVRRAYFYAPVRTKVFVSICEEDFEDGDENRCDELILSMYGTRDVAQNWAEEFTEHLVQIGFVKGKSNPCLF